ncbi:MAG: hypothetical protein M3Y56_11255 [Armatimonadota bacterium]|nr:hypothetical protein [Armatimonadota bacterium]
MPNAVLVAISDSGIVDRPKSPVLPVFKADQIVDQVKLLIKEHKRISSLFNLNVKEIGDSLNKQELDRISNFLLQHHRPLRPIPPQKTAIPAEPAVSLPVTTPSSPSTNTAVPQTAPPQREWACKQCKGSQLRIEFVHNYFFKCQTCGANTRIQLTCKRCGGKETTRKRGSQFFRDCETCGTSTLYYTNP